MFCQENANKILDEAGRGTLWLGDIGAARNFQFLEHFRIKTIISVCPEYNLVYPPDLRISHHSYAISDQETSNIQQYFEQTYNIIYQGLSKGSVLVHCAAGISRSATLIIAYIMKAKNLSFQKALLLVKLKRPQAHPNRGFIRQLQEYSEQRKGTTLQLLNIQPPLARQLRSERLPPQQKSSFQNKSKTQQDVQVNSDYYFLQPRRNISDNKKQDNNQYYKAITKSFSSNRQTSQDNKMWGKK